MIIAVFVLAYLAGAVAVAFWFDRRFPRVAPRDTRHLQDRNLGQSRFLRPAL